jgi:hypothetical protein
LGERLGQWCANGWITFIFFAVPCQQQAGPFGNGQAIGRKWVKRFLIAFNKNGDWKSPHPVTS